MVKFRYCIEDGALVCDEEIEGVTTMIHDSQRDYFGAKYFIAESMSKSAARIIVEKLGGKLEE